MKTRGHPRVKLWLYRTMLALVVILHFLLGVIVFPIFIIFRWKGCPLTTIENRIRAELNLPKIKFIQHYILKNYIRFKRRIRKWKKMR